MQSKAALLFHNWPLKLSSLFLAALLWSAVSNQASSEIGMEVPLEYRNVPAQTEITGDMTNIVDVRLRGPSTVMRDITPKDVSTTIDLAGMKVGETIVPLSPRNVIAPFGAEVLRVNPSSVRFTLERTLRRKVPIAPSIQGELPDGYEIRTVLVSPNEIEIEGPESRVSRLSSIGTVPLRLNGVKPIEQSVDVDVPDSQIRLIQPQPVKVRVEVKPKH